MENQTRMKNHHNRSVCDYCPCFCVQVSFDWFKTNKMNNWKEWLIFLAVFEWLIWCVVPTSPPHKPRNLMLSYDLMCRRKCIPDFKIINFKSKILNLMLFQVYKYLCLALFGRSMFSLWFLTKKKCKQREWGKMFYFTFFTFLRWLPLFQH